MRKNIPFTKIGHENLQKEYEELQKQRVEAVKELTTARDMGDRSENAAYKSARWKLSGIDRRLRQLKKVLATAQIIDRPFTGFADIGCTVIVSDGVKTQTYMLVGGFESDILQGKLSVNSPIGKALLGKKTGDRISVVVPSGNVTYTIEDIRA
jgi:transcription elongation factor GreA